MPRASSHKRGHLSRDALVAAMAALADAQRDLDGVTLAQVAARFGVRVPSLYNHVGGLDDLRRGVALITLRALRAHLADAAAGRAGDDAVRAIGHAYRAFAQQHPGCYAATVRAPDAGDRELIGAASELTALLQRVLAPVLPDPEDALHAIRGLRSLTHGFVMLEAGGGFGLKLDRDESYRRMIDAFIAGLGPTR